MSIQVVSRLVEDILVVELEGRLDTAGAGPAADQLGPLLAGATDRVVLNLTKLEFMSSAGLRMILRSSRSLKAEGGEMKLCGAQGIVQEVLTASGFHNLLHLCDDEAAAVRAFGSGGVGIPAGGLRRGDRAVDAASSGPPLGAWRVERRPGAAPVDGPSVADRPHASPPAERDAAANRFVREGDFWTIEFEAKLVRVRDSRGMQLLARLIKEAGREFHCLELASDAGATAETSLRALAQSDAGPAVDAQARREYENRVRQLARDLEAARAQDDLAQVELLSRELEFLEKELSRGFGLGKRPRRQAAAAERARVNVTRALRGAIKRIGEHHPTLAEHLTSHVRTGNFCTYFVDPRHPSRWQLG